VEFAHLGALVGTLRIHRRRVVAEQHRLDALQAHDPESLRPAPVVADAHADQGVHGAPHGETQVAGFEIAFFQVLEGPFRIVLGMASSLDNWTDYGAFGRSCRKWGLGLNAAFRRPRRLLKGD